MEKRIILDGKETNFWLEDTGRLRNEKTQRWLKGGYNKGYHLYSLYFKGKQYILYTHRVVAEYFVPNPNNYPIVHHIDGDRTNNLYTNLEWITISEHQKTIVEQKKQKNNKAPSRKKISITKLGEMKLAQFRNSPYYISEDGRIFNVSKKIELRFETSGNYYRFVGHYNLGKKHFLVHRAVWEAFNGPIPEGLDIDHIDGNPHNNALSNLQAISHKKNIKKRDMDFSYVINNLNPNR